MAPRIQIETLWRFTQERNPAVQRILGVIRGQPFADAIAALPGYNALQPGVVRSISEMLA